MRLAVAATAPFGADVLERLAATQHEIAYLLTRPDAPRGRGRRSRPPPAKEASRSGSASPCTSPRSRSCPRPVDADRRLRVRPANPAALLDQALWLNVHPSLLPRWRGAAPVERAILAGDEETGVTIHETVEALDAGPIAAQEAFPIGRATTPGRSSSARPRSRRGCSTRCCANPVVHAAARGGRDLRREDHARRPRARPRRPARRVAARAGALAAHRRVDDAARTARHGLARPARRRCVRSRGRGAAGRPQADDLRRVPARCAVIAPARRAAFEVVRRVFEDDAYADRALASAASTLDARDRALAQRIAYGTVQRARAIDHGIDAARQAPGAQARPAGAGGAADRAPTSSRGASLAQHAVVDDAVELVRAAGLRARGGVHERGRAPARRGLPRPRRVAAARAAEGVVSRLDLRTSGCATWERTRRSR